MKIITFKSALEKAIENKNQKPTLLLGNGFSIAFDKKIFGYEGLLESARERNLFQDNDRLSKVFNISKTVNFEQIMEYLMELESIFSNYSMEIQNDISRLKEIIIKALSQSHPNSPHCIKKIQYKHCAQFLRNFKSIYTLNYDLLLYWVIMKENLYMEFKDGFQYPINKVEESATNYVYWYPRNKYFTNLYYLHGGLYLYGATNEIKKYCFSNGRSLKEQIMHSINQNIFPLFVSAESHLKKLEIINRSDYLSNALNNFNHCKDVLFIYGFNFSENDRHILKAIASSKVNKIFISIYRSTNIGEILNSIEEIKILRKNFIANETTLEVIYYDAESAQVWG